MFHHEHPDFFLRGMYFVVFFLICDVGDDFLFIGLAYGKSSISFLPGKVFVLLI